MSSTYRDRTLDPPRTLLPTTRVSDFGRNFAELEKHAKRPYSLTKLIRALSASPYELDGFEIEVNQELKPLTKPIPQRDRRANPDRGVYHHGAAICR